MRFLNEHMVVTCAISNLLRDRLLLNRSNRMDYFNWFIHLSVKGKQICIYRLQSILFRDTIYIHLPIIGALTINGSAIYNVIVDWTVINFISKCHDQYEFVLNLIKLVTIFTLFPLEVVQWCQYCQFCVLRQNLSATFYRIK